MPTVEPNWGCGQSGHFCYDVQCFGGLAPTADEVAKIAAAAEAGNLKLAQELAANYPTLRILKPGQMLFDGPRLAGIPGPDDSPEGVQLACAKRQRDLRSGNAHGGSAGGQHRAKVAIRIVRAFFNR